MKLHIFTMTLHSQICKLCFDNVEEKDEQILDKSIQQMLQVLLINIDTPREKSVICKICHRKLENHYCFKKKCMFTEDTIRPFMVENVKINLYEIRNQVFESVDTEMERNVCRLCLQYSDDDMTLNEEETRLFQDLFPEINLSLTDFMVLCLACYNALQKYFVFVMSCARSDEPLSSYSLDYSSEQLHCNKSEDCQKSLMHADQPNEKKTVLVNGILGIKYEDNSSNIEQITVIKSEGIQLNNEDDQTLILNENLSNQYIGENPTGDNSTQYCVNKLEDLQAKDVILKREKAIKCEEDSSDLLEQQLSSNSMDCSRCQMNDVKLENTHVNIENEKLLLTEELDIKCDGDSSEDKCLYSNPGSTNNNLYQQTKDLEETNGDNCSQLEDHTCKCKKCNYVNKFKTNLKLHAKGKKTDRIYHCDKCNYKTKQKGRFKTHILRHNEPSMIQIYKCKECDCVTKHKSSLKSHILRKHTDLSKIEIYRCRECDYKSTRKGDFNRHILFHHTDPSKIQMYKCTDCDYETKHKSDLKCHIISRHTEMHKCDKCDYEFKSHIYLKKHILTNHTDPFEMQKYQCEECDYKSIKKGNLKQHVLFNHIAPSQIQMYKCKECDYESKYKSALKFHVLSRHTDPSKIKMHKCNECNFEFKSVGSLNRHVRAKHSDASKFQIFQCGECDYNSKQKESLEMHISEEHAESSIIQLYQCDKCDYKCEQKILLQRHFSVQHVDPSKFRKMLSQK